MHKRCLICGEFIEANLDNFYKHKTNKDGFHPYCKPCARKKSIQWGKDNPEKYKALNKRKAENRPEAYKILSREASKRNREEGYQKEWRQNNKDKLKQYNYNHLNKQYEISNEEWESCKKYFNYKCAYCGIGEEAAKETQGHYLHKEHAINSGSNDISNCVPSCRSCNSQKWERDYDEWYTDSLSQFDMNKLNKINKWIKDDHKLYIDSD